MGSSFKIFTVIFISLSVISGCKKKIDTQTTDIKQAILDSGPSHDNDSGLWKDKDINTVYFWMNLKDSKVLSEEQLMHIKGIRRTQIGTNKSRVKNKLTHEELYHHILNEYNTYLGDSLFSTIFEE
jgi:hypothetical protein